MNDNKYLSFPGLSLFFSNLKKLFATKDIVSSSGAGLVPAPKTTDVGKVLSSDCTWQTESVSISSDNAFEDLDGGDV